MLRARSVNNPVDQVKVESPIRLIHESLAVAPRHRFHLGDFSPGTEIEYPSGVVLRRDPAIDRLRPEFQEPDHAE